MSQPDIVCFIEHVARELDIACAIKCLAQRRHGLEVQVTSLLRAATIPPTPRPRLIAVPYFFARREAHLRDVLRRWPEVPVVNLAFEQLFSEGNKRFKRPRDEAARKHVVHLAAGEFFREFLAGHGVTPEHVAVTGSLPCSLYRRPYRDYFEGQRAVFARQHGLDAEKPWVFFPENFAAAFFGPGAIRSRIRQGARPEDVYAYRDFARDSFRETMAWCQAAADMGTVELIVRPRPATARDAFVAAVREVAGDVPRRHLHFIKEATVREWILASDVVVSSYSSTLVEAAVARKPVYLLMPVPLCSSVRVDWSDLPPRVTSRAEFLNLLNDVDSRPVVGPLTAWAEKRLLPHGDAIGNVTELLAALSRGRRAVAPAPPAPSAWQQAAESVKRWSAATDRWFRTTVLRRRNCRTMMHENDLFAPDEVARRTEKWAQVLGSSVDREDSRALGEAA